MAFTTIVEGAEPIPGYRLVRQLGEGRFGQVWQTEHGGVFGAMKVSRELNGLYAIREWQSLKAVMNLNHPNLCIISGVWLKDEHGHVLTDDEVRSLLPANPRKNQPSKQLKPPEGSKSTTRPPAWNPQAQVPRPARVHLDKTIAVDDEAPPAPETQSGAGTDIDPGDDNGIFSRRKLGEGMPPLQLFIAMDKGDGTLLSRLEQCEEPDGIPRGELVKYLENAADGLYFLNKRGIHHCDVKPENLLLVGGAVKVCDYGSALKSLETNEEHTSQGYTPAYAAPEQMHRKKVIVYKSTDQYALALTYFAMLTRSFPWDKDSSAFDIYKIKESQRFDLTALNALAPKMRRTGDSHEARAVRKALRYQPGERYEEITDFVAAVKEGIRQDEEEAQEHKRRRRRRALAVVAMFAVFTLAAVGSWYHKELSQAIAKAFGTGPEIGKGDLYYLLKGRLTDLKSTPDQSAAAWNKHDREAAALVAEICATKSRLGLELQSQDSEGNDWADLLDKSILEVWQPRAKALSRLDRFAGVAELKKLEKTIPAEVLESAYKKIIDDLLQNDKAAADAANDAIALAKTIEGDPQGMNQERMKHILEQSGNEGMKRLNAGAFEGLASSFQELQTAAHLLIASKMFSDPDFKRIEQNARVRSYAAAFLAARDNKRIEDLEALHKTVESELKTDSNSKEESLDPANRARLRLLKTAFLAHIAGDGESFAGMTKELLTKDFGVLTADWEQDLIDEIQGRGFGRIRDELTNRNIDQAEEALESLESSNGDSAQFKALRAWWDVLKHGPNEGRVLKAVAAFRAWGPNKNANEAFRKLADQIVKDGQVSDDTLAALIPIKFDSAASDQQIDRLGQALVGVLRGQRAVRDYKEANPAMLAALREDCKAWQAVDGKLREELSVDLPEGTMLGIIVEAGLESDASKTSDSQDTGLTAVIEALTRLDTQDEYVRYVQRLARFCTNRARTLASEDVDVLASIDFKRNLAFALLHRRNRLAEMISGSTQLSVDLPTLGPVRLRLPSAERADREWKLLSLAFSLATEGDDNKDDWRYELATNYTLLAYLRHRSMKEVDWNRLFTASTAAAQQEALADIDDGKETHTRAEIVRAYALAAKALASTKVEAEDRAVLDAVRQLLDSEFDPFGVPRRFDREIVYEFALEPFLSIAERNVKNVKSDQSTAQSLAAFYGALGVYLESDPQSDGSIAFPALKDDATGRLVAIYQCFRRAREAQEQVAAAPGDGTRLMRWLASELLSLCEIAREQTEQGTPSGEVMQKDLSSQALELKSIGGAWRDALASPSVKAHDRHFVVLACQVRYDAFQGVTKELAADRIKFLGECCKSLEDAGSLLNQEKVTKETPWALRFLASIQALKSSMHLNSSWCYAWGIDKKNSLRRAIMAAEESEACVKQIEKLQSRFRGWKLEANATVWHLCKGSAYEDMECHQKMPGYLDLAEQEFKAVVDDTNPFVTDSLKWTAKCHLLRVKTRRLLDDIAAMKKRSGGDTGNPNEFGKRFEELSQGFADVIPRIASKSPSNAIKAQLWEMHLLRQMTPRDFSNELQKCHAILNGKPSRDVMVDASVWGVEAAIAAKASDEVVQFGDKIKQLRSGKRPIELRRLFRSQLTIAKFRDSEFSLEKGLTLAGEWETELQLNAECKARILLALAYMTVLKPAITKTELRNGSEFQRIAGALPNPKSLEGTVPDELRTELSLAQGQLQLIAAIAADNDRSGTVARRTAWLATSLQSAEDCVDYLDKAIRICRTLNKDLSDHDEFVSLTDILCQNFDAFQLYVDALYEIERLPNDAASKALKEKAFPLKRDAAKKFNLQPVGNLTAIRKERLTAIQLKYLDDVRPWLK
jgi:serine/threonine protein kinase